MLACLCIKVALQGGAVKGGGLGKGVRPDIYRIRQTHQVECVLLQRYAFYSDDNLYDVHLRESLLSECCGFSY
jgi:hypothetical protein